MQSWNTACSRGTWSRGSEGEVEDPTQCNGVSQSPGGARDLGVEGGEERVSKPEAAVTAPFTPFEDRETSQNELNLWASRTVQAEAGGVEFGAQPAAALLVGGERQPVVTALA